MGISSQYDRTTGAYTGGGTDPNPYKSGSSNTGSGNNSNTPVLGNQTNTPAPLVPNSPQFQQGSYGFDSNANKIPVNLGNGQVINGVMKDGYTYVPIKQMANMMGGQLGNYDPNNLTIQVNGKTVPVHIDSNGVGYAPVRNMADAFGASVGWNSKSDGSVSDVFLAQPTVNQQQPVIDQQKLLEEQQLAERQKMIEELLKQFQQPIPMPQMPEMPQIPQQQPSYEDFLERAREMINPAYAKARETLSKVNEQQRQLMIQRLAAKGQPFGGLREEMEMQLAQDFMNQLSDQDMQQLSEALKIAQSLSEQDEQQARWLADQAWQRWQAQANMAQQQYQYAVADRNNRLTGLMNLARYLQEEEQARREAALEQAKFYWQQKKDLLPYTTPDANTVFRMGNISADKAADLEMERWKWENPSANAYLGYQGDLARANSYSSNYTPPQWVEQQGYDAVANQFADALQSYASYEDMIGGIQSAKPYLDPMTAEALMRLAKSMEPLYYYTNPAGQKVGKSGPKFKPAEESPTGGYDPLRVKWNTSPYAGSQYGGTIDGAMPGAHEVNQFLNKPEQPQVAAPQSFWQRLMGALSGSRSIEDY
ncbi:MAG: hypothetical protein K6T66_08730 [Peptococcaceae bacterium]|nr:hypothetical protein [Peptococcaceae bacterium]